MSYNYCKDKTSKQRNIFYKLIFIPTKVVYFKLLLFLHILDLKLQDSQRDLGYFSLCILDKPLVWNPPCLITTQIAVVIIEISWICFTVRFTSKQGIRNQDSLLHPDPDLTITDQKQTREGWVMRKGNSRDQITIQKTKKWQKKLRSENKLRCKNNLSTRKQCCWNTVSVGTGNLPYSTVPNSSVHQP